MEDEDVEIGIASEPAPIIGTASNLLNNSDQASLQDVDVNEDHQVSVRTDEQLKKIALVKLSRLQYSDDSRTQEAEIENQNEDQNSNDSSPRSPKKVNGDYDQKEEEPEGVAEDDSVSADPVSLDETNEVALDETNEIALDNSRKRKKDGDQTNSHSDDESDVSSSGDSSPTEFKGFKKRKVVPCLKIKMKLPEQINKDIREPIQKLRLKDLKEKKGFSMNNVDSGNENETVDEEVSVDEESEVIEKRLKPQQAEGKSNAADTVEKPRMEPRRSARNLASAAKKRKDTPNKPESEDQLTEYAQYLGLQPTVKFKCYMCGQSHFQSMGSLNNHQKTCGKNSSNSYSKPSVPTGDSNLSTNFRITRKVYLCSACGTYYENWKLFLHMRDRHKRHICLFCLGMFSVADKLAEHLLFKHNVHENTCKSPEEFLNLFKGSCFLTCCSCEKMFTERENFFDHKCKELTPVSAVRLKDAPVQTQKCTSCNVKYGHFQTCPKVKEKQTNQSSAGTVNKNLIGSSPKKYYIPVPTDLQNASSDVTDASRDGCIDIRNSTDICQISVGNGAADKKTSEKTYSARRMETRSRTAMKIQNDYEVESKEDTSVKTPEEMEVGEDETNRTEATVEGIAPEVQEEDSINRVNEVNEKNRTEDKIPMEVISDDVDQVKEEVSTEEPGRSPQKEVESVPPPFENNYNKNLDSGNKSDDSEDSDKLSVVLSDEEGNEKIEEADDERKDEDRLQNGEDETRDEMPKEPSQGTARDISVDGEKLQLASDEVTAMALTLEDKMEALSSQYVLKECVRTSCTTCGYCSHAVKIGVNGKQLALHLLAEHRYMPIKNETVDDVIERLKNSLVELQDTWFNTDSYDSSDKSCFVRYDHTYECFQCNYVTKLYKDLFVHKRKVHQKTILYCSMCKANFYSYSELICHMCPGVYVSKDIQYRCCFCELDRIPSAFRLMVHLRKSHHTCDICLENAGDQQKLSTHMWKHKLHHLCYRCGIAYRNKPDITKHLFWKHGTESVLCKKCLQKKWPHVYHFCIPPTIFICEECNLTFSKAVALKVHKRLHSGEFPYCCATCQQKFVSKKLLQKHEKVHLEPPPEEVAKDEKSPSTETADTPAVAEKVNDTSGMTSEITPLTNEVKNQGNSCDQKERRKKNKKDKEKKVKPVVDVYDLPPLNLSSESDESEDEKEKERLPVSASSVTAGVERIPYETGDLSEVGDVKEAESALQKEPDDKIEEKQQNTQDALPSLPSLDLLESESTLEETDKEKEVEGNKITEVNSEAVESSVYNSEEQSQPVQVVDGIWDSFHTYRAEQEKRENLDVSDKQPLLLPDEPVISAAEAALADHDYCTLPEDKEPSPEESESIVTDKNQTNEYSSSIDHDYCNMNSANKEGLPSSVVDKSTVSLQSSPKKKVKSPKKKTSKPQHSSSSSDSSSDSDSSSCSCGTNCSCTSSSSNSSSSSSSDSDSSSSDGGKLNDSGTVGKKKRGRKRADANTQDAQPLQEEEPIVDLPVEPEEPPILESDLDTEESSTDEDFYDQYPQRFANQLLAEKRNQLMVLASVAPVNNGTASPPATPLPIPETALTPTSGISTPLPVEPQSTPVSTGSKRKVKSKRRRKTEKVAQIVPPSYDSQPSTSFSLNPSNVLPVKKPVTSLYSLVPTTTISNNAFVQDLDNSDVDSKRLSKRRRVRNKFYGYSSDEEEGHRQPGQTPKLKKTAQPHIRPPQPSFLPSLPQTPPRVMETIPQQQEPISDYGFHMKAMQLMRSVENRGFHNSSQDSASRVDSSSSTSSDDSDEPDGPVINPVATAINPPGFGTGIATEKDDKLYCYCQCPYDEVSEMIACDGGDCAIEWFHFECVGIMVPPKGKWYCPDCRKRGGILN